MSVLRPTLFVSVYSVLVCLAPVSRLSAQTFTATPTQLVFNSQNGVSPAAQTVSVTSSGGPLAFTTSAFSNGGWLSVTPQAGTTPQALSVSVNPASLTSASYSGFITVGNGNQGVLTIPVTLNVAGTGNSSVSATPGSLTFTFLSGAAFPQTQPLSISSTIPAAATVGVTPSTTTGGNWLTVNTNSVNVAPGAPASVDVSVSPSGLTAGVYNGVIALTPPGSTGAIVPVQVTIGNAPGLTVAPAQLSFAYQINQANPAQQNLAIGSGTGSPINFAASASTTTCGANWIVLTQQSGSTPGTVGVQINPATLQPGNCTGQITISAPGTSIPTQTIPVNLLVSTNPLIQVPSTGANFTFQTGGSTPAAQNVQITSSSTALAITAAATPINGGVNFLTVTPAAGTTPQALALSLNNAVLSGLAPGTYTENVTVTSTGAGNSPQTFPVTLVVSNVPILSASQTSATFNYQIGQTAPQNQIVTLSSTGAPLNYTVTATNTNCNGFLSATPATGSTQGQPGQSGQIVLAVNTTGITAAATCTGNVTLSVPGTTNTPLTIPVTLNASTTPLLNASQAAISVTVITGSATITQPTISLTSTDGTTPLNFTATASTNPAGLTWLSVTPNTGSTPNNLILTINPAGLTAGIYQGSISLSSTSPNVPMQTIPVTLIIASGTITATPAALSFSQALNGPQPATQSIQVAGIPTGATVGATATMFNGTGWLTAATGATAGTVTVTANGAGLPQGIYQGIVTLLVPGATPSPLNVPVTLTVGTPQALTITPATLSFNFQAGSPTTPAAQTVQLASTGGNVPYTAVFTPGTGGNFVTVTPASGNTPSAIAIALNQSVLSTLNAGTYTGVVTIASPSVPNGTQVLNVTLTVTAAGPPNITAVVNAANNQPGGVAPGELISIYGAGIGPVTPAGLQLTTNGTVSTNLANTVVLFDGVAAPLTYVSANQINAIVPYQVAGRTSTNVVVQRAGVNSASLNIQVAGTAPAIFSLNQGGAGQGAILNQDATVNGTARPAAKGSVVSIFATGEGALMPGGVTGTVTGTTGPFPKPVADVSLTIGGAPATIQYAGEAPGLVSGVMQINAVIPQNAASGNQQVVLTIGNNSSLANITVAVQ